MKKDTYNFTACLSVEGEMIPGKGEDSFSRFIGNDKGYIGVFDGCGGSGAKRYKSAGDHTGAYLASRTCAYVMWKRISSVNSDDSYICAVTNEQIENDFKETLLSMKHALSVPGEMNIKGSLQLTLPTTAAMLFYEMDNRKVYLNYLWAGDSRGYILTKNGLAQVTRDDIDSQEDAMTNLLNDAKMTNVINADKSFVLHKKLIDSSEPCVAFAATDGVFGYIPTPMEFEFMLLKTLQKAGSVMEWEHMLGTEIKKYASDDYTLEMIIFGIDSFEELKMYFDARYKYVYKSYISVLRNQNDENKAKASAILWEQYKVYYEKYINVKEESVHGRKGL